jgi:hypothetical protein
MPPGTSCNLVELVNFEIISADTYAARCEKLLSGEIRQPHSRCRSYSEERIVKVGSFQHCHDGSLAMCANAQTNASASGKIFRYLEKRSIWRQALVLLALRSRFSSFLSSPDVSRQFQG